MFEKRFINCNQELEEKDLWQSVVDFRVVQCLEI